MKEARFLSQPLFRRRRKIFNLLCIIWGFSLYYHNSLMTSSRQLRIVAGSSMGTMGTNVDPYDMRYLGKVPTPTASTVPSYQVVEPSHIQICRKLLPRLQKVVLKYTLEERTKQFGIEGLNFTQGNTDALTNKNATEAGINMDMDLDTDINEVITIWEDKSLCDPSYSTSSSALIQVMASSLLNEASRAFGLNVQYRYPCQKMNSIQDWIVHEIDMGRELSSVPLSAASIRDLCWNCLQDFDHNHERFQGMNCILFATPVSIGQGSSKAQSGIGAIWPQMKDVMTKVRERWLKQIEDEGRGHHSYLQIRHVTSELKTREEMELIADGYQINEDNPDDLSTDGGDDEKIETDGDEADNLQGQTASIYISCPYETCNTNQPAHAMHYSTYKKYIPENIPTISVFISEICSSHIIGCRNHAHSLFAYLSDHYPDTRLELIQSDHSNTVATYVTLTNSDFLICPPGQGCIIPSIFMKEGARAILASDQTTPKWYRDLPLVSMGIWLLPVGGLGLKEVSQLDESVTI